MRVFFGALALIFMLFINGVASGIFARLISDAKSNKDRQDGEPPGTSRVRKPKSRSKYGSSQMHDALDLHANRHPIPQSSSQPDLDLRLAPTGQSEMGWNEQQMYGQQYTNQEYDNLLNQHHASSAQRNSNSRTPDMPTQQTSNERKRELREKAKERATEKAWRRQQEAARQGYNEEVANTLAKFANDPHLPNFPKYPGYQNAVSGYGYYH